MSDGVLVYFRGGPWDKRVQEMPDARPHWSIPHKAERLGAFYFGTSLGPLPQPALYTRVYPHEWERVLTADLVVKEGTRLEDFDIVWAHASVYECVSEGGR